MHDSGCLSSPQVGPRLTQSKYIVSVKVTIEISCFCQSWGQQKESGRIKGCMRLSDGKILGPQMEIKQTNTLSS